MLAFPPFSKLSETCDSTLNNEIEKDALPIPKQKAYFPLLLQGHICVCLSWLWLSHFVLPLNMTQRISDAIVATIKPGKKSLGEKKKMSTRIFWYVRTDTIKILADGIDRMTELWYYVPLQSLFKELFVWLIYLLLQI